MQSGAHERRRTVLASLDTSMKRLHVACLWCVSAMAVMGCENREPVSLVEACIIPAVDRLRATGRSVDVECDLGREAFLVAVPDLDTGNDDFMRLGMSADAADMVRNREISRPRWCTVNEEMGQFDRPAASSDKRLIASVQCVTSTVSIPKAAVTRAKNITVSLKPSGQAVTLTGLAARRSR